MPAGTAASGRNVGPRARVRIGAPPARLHVVYCILRVPGLPAFRHACPEPGHSNPPRPATGSQQTCAPPPLLEPPEARLRVRNLRSEVAVPLVVEDVYARGPLQIHDFLLLQIEVREAVLHPALDQKVVVLLPLRQKASRQWYESEVQRASKWAASMSTTGRD